MRKAYLKRLSDDGKATIGRFYFSDDNGDNISIYSLELPWKENKKSISCIPKGIYKVITTYSNRFKKDMWLLLNVPDREGIRIHSANYSHELEGCIALGLNQTDLNNDGTPDIANSRKAMELARQYLGKEFLLEIY